MTTRTCARCGHDEAKHHNPGDECVQVVGRDAKGDVFCSCERFEAPRAHDAALCICGHSRAEHTIKIGCKVCRCVCFALAGEPLGDLHAFAVRGLLAQSTVDTLTGRKQSRTCHSHELPSRCIHLREVDDALPWIASITLEPTDVGRALLGAPSSMRVCSFCALETVEALRRIGA